MATLTLRPAAAQQARQRVGLDKPAKGPPGLSPEEARRARGRLVDQFQMLLAREYPALFPVAGAPPRAPLAIGIDRALRARHPEIASRTLRIALHRHTSAPAYLALLIAGATRIDLDGLPAGTVTAEQAQRPVERLQRRGASRAPAGSRAP